MGQRNCGMFIPADSSVFDIRYLVILFYTEHSVKCFRGKAKRKITACSPLSTIRYSRSDTRLLYFYSGNV